MYVGAMPSYFNFTGMHSPINAAVSVLTLFAWVHDVYIQ